MAELTKEQLIEEAKLKIAITKCHPNSGMARIEGELFKIALASLEAEPVAWKATFTQIDHEYNTFTAMYSDKAEAKRWVRLHKVGDFRAEITPLYAASPALVVPDKLPREYIRGWPLAYSDYAEGWNDCREAMLQSGSFRENKDSSTNNFRKISETSTNSPVIPDGLSTVCAEAYQVVGVMADALGVFGDAAVQKVLDNLSQQKLVHRDVLPFSLPVTPDGWISCSERMPEETGDIIVVSDGIVMSGISYSRRDGFYIAALEYDDDEPIDGVTHWMPLPEPPQEVRQ